jgi:hypothetical protein
MRARVALKLAVAVALLVPFGCGGNGCSKGKVIVNEPVITFQFPTDASQVVPTDDVNTSAPGIQVNVAAKVENMKAGESLYLWNDTDGVQSRIEGTVQGKQVAFPGYTLPAGRVTLYIAIPTWEESMGCGGQRCAQVTITVIAAACTYNDPKDGDILAVDQYPVAGDPLDPFEKDVTLGCLGMDASDPRNHVELRVSGGRALTALPDAAGTVTFPRIAFAEGSNTLAAVPYVVTTTGVGDPATPGTTANATVTVATGRCLAALEPIDGSSLLALDDYDVDPSNGMQATIDLITNCDEASDVVLHYRKRSATEPQPAFTTLTVLPSQIQRLLDPVGARIRLQGVQLDESAGPSLYDIELIGTVAEAAGQRGVTVPTRYWVDSIPPTLVSWSPGDGACVGAPQDLYPAIPGIQIDAFGLVAGAENGAEVWLTTSTTAVPPTACAMDTECAAPQLCRALLCRSVGTVAAGSFVVRQVPVPAGTVTFEYVASDLAGNASQLGTAEVVVFESSPTVTITAPTNNANLGVNDDLDKNTPGLQYGVQISVTNVPGGTLGTLLTGERTYSFLPPSGAAGDVTRQVALTDGTHTLTARVQDPCGTSVDSAPVVVNVFAAPTALGVTAYAADNSVCAGFSGETACKAASAVVGCMWNDTGTTGCVAGFAARHKLADGATIRGATVDLDVVTGLGIAGHPHAVTVDLFASSTGTGANRVCAGTPTTGPAAIVADTAPGVLLTGVTLLTGMNCVQVSVDDGINTLAANIMIGAAGTMPNVTIAPPTSGAIADSDSDPANGFNQTIVATLSAAHTRAGIMEVRVGKGAHTFGVFRAQLAIGDTVATFTHASLPYGPLDLVAVFTDLNGQSRESPVVAVTAGAVTPEIAIISPRTGTEVDIPSPATDVAVAVQVAYIGTGTPGTNLSCSLFDGGTSLETGTWVAPATTPLTLSHLFVGGSYDLHVECGSAVTQTITVSVAGTVLAVPQLRSEDPGVVGRLVFSPPGYVNGLVVDGSAVAGVQHAIDVVVDVGAFDPTGWVVDLLVTPPGATSPTVYYMSVIPSGGGAVLVTFGNVLLTDVMAGSVTLQACVTNTTGDVRCGAPVTLTVDRVPPVLTQTYPPPAVTLLGRNPYDSNVDPTYVDFGFQYSVTGDAVGNVSLTVAPPTHGKTAVDFPLVKATAATVTFDTLAFADGLYFADAWVDDAAGNRARALGYGFEVKGLEANINWAIPGGPGFFDNTRDTNPTSAGIQATFAFNVVGFNPGTVLKLCSTAATAGAIGTCAAGDELKCCRWHPDGNKDNIRTNFGTVDATAGYVIGTGVLSGSLASSSAFLSGVTLADGDQTIHAEAVEPSKDPDGFSSFFAFGVDSVPPIVETITLGKNNATNDPTGYILLGPTECKEAPAACQVPWKTPVAVTVTGSAVGRTITIVSSLPSAGTVVGSATLGGDVTTQSATFDIAPSAGRQALTVKVSDVVGNVNVPAADHARLPDILLDLTPGNVTLPGPLYGTRPYTSADGAVNVGNRTLPIALTLTVQDNESLAGAHLTLRSFDAASGGTELESFPVTLTAGQTTVDFPAFLLHMGRNYLEATLVDAAGNQTVVPRSQYDADFFGPDLVLKIYSGRSGSPVERTACGTFGTPCPADYFNPVGANSGRAKLDTLGTDGFKTTSLTPPDGTDLRFSLTRTAGDHASIDNGTASVWLESTLGDGTGAYDGVYASQHAEAGDVALDSYDLRPGAAGYALDPGDRRGVRVAAMDPNGNVSYSATLFLQLDLSGVLVSVRRVDAAMIPVGPELVDDTFWGPGDNFATPPAFATNLRVVVTPIGAAAPTPTDVDIAVNGGSTQNKTLTAGPPPYANYPGVAFVTSPSPADRLAAKQNTLSVTVNCGASLDCGARVYTGIIADIVPPSFQFDRCSLCGLKVPLVNSGTICPISGCSDTGQWDANDAADIGGAGAPAIWNAALDQDGNSSNGFSILSAGVPLTVKLLGLEPGEHVRVVSETALGVLRTGLTGNDVLSTGCVGATCAGTATFGALNLPSLSGADKVHVLHVSFTDRAGNTGKVDVGRDPEKIFAKTDVLVPGAAQPLVCIGESTTPYTITTPASDPTTYEDPSCSGVSGHCAVSGACDRRKGKATLVWAAPYDDGGAGNKVASYEILVAARGIPYPQRGRPLCACDTGGGCQASCACDPDCGQTTYTSCSDLVSSRVEQTIAMAATAAPGGQETAAITDLYPHASYCFAVLGVDDVGNRAVVASSVKERAMPLINYPSVVSFDPVSPADEQASGAFYKVAGSTWFGYAAANVGDLNGDGRDDLAVTRVSDAYSVSVFLSSTGLADPAVVISGPTLTAGGFGRFVAGGDFDNDGFSDLVICASSMTAMVGSVAQLQAGAAYVYYGRAGEGIRRDVNGGDTILPSIMPDVAIFGAAGSKLCYSALLANVDGRPGADLVVRTDGSSNRPRVYGFVGGSRSRFPSSAPMPAVINLDFTSAAGPGFANRPDFSLRGKSVGAAFFPQAIAAADTDGDGVEDVVVSDHGADHDTSATCNACGEVYVFRGGAALSGDVAAPDLSPPQLMNVLRYTNSGANFGQNLQAVPHPRSAAGDSGDWILALVGSGADAQNVVVFQGSSLATPPGIVPAVYPPGGLPPTGSPPQSQYDLLDRTSWLGTPAPLFGWSMATLGELDGHGGVDIVVGPGHTTGAARFGTYLFSLNTTTGHFEKRAMLYGPAGFGNGLAAVSGFVAAATEEELELLVLYRAAGSVYLFR